MSTIESSALGFVVRVVALLTTLAVVAVPRAATASNLCVDNTDGGCVTAGSFAVCPTNYCTIGAAISDASAGDTITVAAGTYNENNLFLTSAKSPLTLRGAQQGVPACGRVASETIISNTTGPLLDLGTSHDSVVDGFTFTGVTSGGVVAGTAIQSTVGPNDRDQLLNNRVNGFTGPGVFLNRQGADMTVDNNEFDGSSQTGNADVFHLDTKDFAGFQFTNNCVQNGRATGFFVDGNHTVHAGAPGTRAPLFDHNTISKCGTGTNLGSQSFTGGTIGNNLFSSNTFDGLQGGIQNSSITDNEFVGNGRNGLTLTSFGSSNAARGAQNDTVTDNGFCSNGFGSFCSGSGAVCTNDTQCPSGQTCTAHGTGIFFSASQAATTIATNTANNNNISGNFAGATYTGTETVNATNNWWGTATGPTPLGSTVNPGGTGDTAGTSATLTVVPFLSAPEPTAVQCPPPPTTTTTSTTTSTTSTTESTTTTTESTTTTTETTTTTTAAPTTTTTTTAASTTTTTAASTTTTTAASTTTTTAASTTTTIIGASTTTTVGPSTTTTTTPCVPQPENTSTACGDMVDNDCDGLIDCADPDCTGIFPCPRASKDPTIIQFRRSVGGLDMIRGHAKLQMAAVDLTAMPVSVLLSNLSGRIFSDGLPAGALTLSPSGTIYLFRNPSARTNGGMYSVKIKKNKDKTSYTFSFTSYGDLSAANASGLSPAQQAQLANMRLQFYIGDDANAARDGRVFITLNTPWTQTSRGWRAPKDH